MDFARRFRIFFPCLGVHELYRVLLHQQTQFFFGRRVRLLTLSAQPLRETLRQDLRIRAYEDQRFAAAGDRRAAVFEEWMAGLRRRGDVSDLYLTAR